ncbi:MAG TPA: type I-E CRISPR-associated endoribonuclease Cas2e [Dehalococcoidia bacterium]|nr:type I-E CRISPR-associated endoribonuclease Cas2e [Dehalococcoidia bacterium]
MMVVLILERVPVSLRGELTRWLLEVRAGVFVGDVSALVREKLWELVEEKAREGAAVLVHNADSEQSFAMRLHGEASRDIAEFDGLYLVRRH